MNNDIISQLVNQYTGSISNLQTGSITLGKELFNGMVLASVGLLGINHLLRKNVDMSEANFELIKWLIYLDCFYAFIANFPSIYSFVFNGFQQIGNYLGAKAAGYTVDITPSHIFHLGISLALKILGSATTINLFRNLLYSLVSVVTAVVILFCFASIGLELVLVQIGSQIILAGGVFLLAFSGFQWTRDYAERYVHTFFHVGIKIVFIYILVGLGVQLSQGWIQLITDSSWTKALDNNIAIGLASYVYYKICLKLPDQAVTWLTGRLAMGFDVTTDIKGAVKTVASLPAGVNKIKDYALEKAHQFAGNSKAVHAAQNTARINLGNQGKELTRANMAEETIKTLGSAWKRETWDKKVDETTGGKMAKDINDNMPVSVPPEDYTI